MFVRCWGARGSLPVSGPEYAKYGGSTPCVEVRNEDEDIIIIDAGSGIRKLGNLLLEEGRSSYVMIFTHAHWDHILGFPFFMPLYKPNTKIRIIACPEIQKPIKKIISTMMRQPNFPVTLDDVRAEITFQDMCGSFSIGSVTIDPIPLSHPSTGFGFRFQEQDRRFVFLTDNELGYRHAGGMLVEDYVRFSEGADLLIHDAEYRPREYKYTRMWGHSVYTEALDAALKAGAMRLGLYHHNVERTDDDIDFMVDDCNAIIRERGATLECFGMTEKYELSFS